MTYERTIGRFQVSGDPIGRGSVADVYLAEDPQQGHKVALKVIHIPLLDPERLAAERRGLKIQKQLSDDVPQIARIYEVTEQDETMIVVMEYVEGQDLSRLLPLPPPERSQ